MNINLHIDRLILDGVTLSQRERTLLGASLEAELTRLLTTGGLPTTFPISGAVPSVSASAMQMNNNPVQMGQQIAQAVYGGNGS
jgi:hypothetical protein